MNRATHNNVFGLLLPQSVIPSTGPAQGTNSLNNVWGSAVGLLVSWEPVDFGLRKANVETFRDGQAATLDDVIHFYNRGGDPVGRFLGGPKEIQPLHLSAEEKEWLLTGEPVPTQYLQDLHNP